MELWFIYALISTFLAGFITFGFKVAAQYNFDSRLVISFLNLSLGIVSLSVWLYLGADTAAAELILALGIASGFGNAFSNIFKVLSLKDIDTAIFFPIYKTLGPIAITFIGISLFQESFSTFEIIGIVTGVVVPLLLIHKNEKDRQGNLWRGVLFLLFALLFSLIAATVTKAGADSTASLWLFMTAMGFSGAIFALVPFIQPKLRQKIRTEKLLNTKTVLLGVALGLIEVVLTYTFILALAGGSLAIVYTINSFYILIPIVLSVWFYQEHMNLRKGFAIGLSILAVVFFGL